jgi:hypothetical protein
MTLLNWFERLDFSEDDDDFAQGYRTDLCEETAKQLEQVAINAHGGRFSWAAINGAAIERTFGLLNAAEANLLRLAPRGYVASSVPNLVARAKSSLPENDPRLSTLKKIEERVQKDASPEGGAASKKSPISSVDRGVIVAAYEGANVAARKEELRVRSFRNVILSTAAAATVLVVIIAFLGFLHPTWAPLCFAPPDQLVCPTSSVDLKLSANTGLTIAKIASSWDAAVIAFVGMLGAAISAAAALGSMRGSADPYSLPVALAVLKLPIGALTAFLGLLLISAGFVPGLSALDSSAQVIAWAIVLGYAQQLFTRFVDTQAKTVLAQSSTNGGDPKSGA